MISFKRFIAENANYHKGLAKSTKKKREAQFKKQAKMDDDNPKAYKPAPGDARAKTKPSKHTKKYHAMYGEELSEDVKAGLQKKADKTGISYSVLKKVYDRGVAAWKSGHRPGTTPSQWGYARVNSFVTKSKGTWGGADKDLAAKVRKESFSLAEEGGAGEWGTDKLTNKYKQDTPGEEITEAEYQGKKVKLNDPFRLPSGSDKKFGVYVTNDKGNVVKVTFGDPNMEIKRDDPDRRRSFRARHNCDDPGPKWKARYWSCYQWRAGAKVDN